MATILTAATHISLNIYLDYREERVKEARRAWMEVIMEVKLEGCPKPPASKVFKPKHILPKLPSYRGAAPPGYWESFPSNMSSIRPSLICHKALRWLSKEHGVKGPMLEQVLLDLEFGADIGCKGKCRDPTRSTNAPSAYEFGAQVSDAIAEWMAFGIWPG